MQPYSKDFWVNTSFNEHQCLQYQSAKFTTKFFFIKNWKFQKKNLDKKISLKIYLLTGTVNEVCPSTNCCVKNRGCVNVVESKFSSWISMKQMESIEIHTIFSTTNSLRLVPLSQNSQGSQPVMHGNCDGNTIAKESWRIVQSI